MKKSFIFLCAMLVATSTVYAYNFKAVNERGDSLAFNILSDSTVEFTFDVKGSQNAPSYNYLTCDTLYLPETVNHNTKKYTVTTLGEMCLHYITPNIHSLYIPHTIDSIQYYWFMTAASWNPLKSFIVDEDNPIFCSSNDILYTKDKKELIAYPNNNPKDSVFIEEGVESIAPFAFTLASAVRHLELPLTLKKMGYGSIVFLDSVRSIVIKDSIEEIGENAIQSSSLTQLTLGAGLKSVNYFFVVTDSILNLSCRAIIPPTITGCCPNDFIPNIIARGSRLLVPRQSINAYRQADGWKNFGENILPIEPPVVSTEEGVTISWVQSFSATGYVWYLYKDEAHTQLAMSLAFDKDGRLQEIVLNSPAPQRVGAEAVEEGNNEAERFAEYFSFTIKNLSANINYYYLRQTLCQGEVIETEEGTFNTTPDTPTAIQGPTPSLPAIEGEDKVTKILQDGTILLLRNGKRYTICGEEHQ